MCHRRANRLSQLRVLRFSRRRGRGLCLVSKLAKKSQVSKVRKPCSTRWCLLGQSTCLRTKNVYFIQGGRTDFAERRTTIGVVVPDLRLALHALLVENLSASQASLAASPAPAFFAACEHGIGCEGEMPVGTAWVFCCFRERRPRDADLSPLVLPTSEYRVQMAATAAVDLAPTGGLQHHHRRRFLRPWIGERSPAQGGVGRYSMCI